jgi:hypothetical protein
MGLNDIVQRNSEIDRRPERDSNSRSKIVCIIHPRGHCAKVRRRYLFCNKSGYCLCDASYCGCNCEGKKWVYLLASISILPWLISTQLAQAEQIKVDSFPSYPILFYLWLLIWAVSLLESLAHH